MADLLARINAEPDCDLLVKAGLAHLWFLTVHPFGDGNDLIAKGVLERDAAGGRSTSYSLSQSATGERE